MISLILTLILASSSALEAPSAPVPQAQEAALQGGSSTWTGRDWIVNATDNICGLRDARQLTYPALIDFQACLDATPEMKRARDQGIDPSSAKGIKLRNDAVNRVTRACNAVRKNNGHCSVWKVVRHKDGRAITDISSQVIARF